MKFCLKGIDENPQQTQHCFIEFHEWLKRLFDRPAIVADIDIASNKFLFRLVWMYVVVAIALLHIRLCITSSKSF